LSFNKIWDIPKLTYNYEENNTSIRRFHFRFHPLLGCGGGDEAITHEDASSEAEKAAGSMNSDAEKAAAEAEAKKAMEDLKSK
jgi:hypothetical protein